MTPEQRQSAVDRYWRKVGTADGCWTWSGQTRNGYGVLGIGKWDKVYAHRLSVEIATGQPIPDGMHVCHTCDNPPCTNPDHLFLGSNAENAADARAKGLRMKPTCRRGHPRTAANLYLAVDKRGYLLRVCRVCRAMKERERKAG